MTIPEASQLVIQAGAMGRGGEILVLDMGEPVKIVDLAADMIRLSGLKLREDIDIEFVGTRPGEKLFEELHCVGEQHVATSHPKIMVAESQKVELALLQQSLNALDVNTGAGKQEILQQLRDLVPQFQADGEQLSKTRRAA